MSNEKTELQFVCPECKGDGHSRTFWLDPCPRCGGTKPQSSAVPFVSTTGSRVDQFETFIKSHWELHSDECKHQFEFESLDKIRVITKCKKCGKRKIRYLND